MKLKEVVSEKKKAVSLSATGFILSALGTAIGLGNIWGFPTKLMRFGGPAFLLPYVLAVLFLGLPLLILEINMGNRWRKSPFAIFSRYIGTPGRWFGYFQVVVQYMIAFYYTIIISWVVLTGIASLVELGQLATPDYFTNNIQGKSELNRTFLNPFGNIQTTLLICFIGVTLFAVIIVGFGIVNGIERVNKIMVPSLFLIIVCLMVYAVFLPGSTKGLQKVFYPDFTKLADGKAWSAAFGQALFSLSLGVAVIIVYSASSPEGGDNSTRAITIMSGDTLIALMASVIVAAVLGYGLNNTNAGGNLFGSYAEVSENGTSNYYVHSQLGTFTASSGSKIKETGITFFEGLTKSSGTNIPVADWKQGGSLANQVQKVDKNSLEVFGGGSIVFKAFPQLFNQIGKSWGNFSYGASLFSFAFFLAMFFAAISSLIGLYEPIVSSAEEDYNIPRPLTISAAGGLSIFIALPFLIPVNNGVWDNLIDGLFTTNLMIISAFLEAAIFAFAWRNLQTLTKHNNKSSAIKLGRWFQIVLIVSTFFTIGIFAYGFIGPALEKGDYFNNFFSSAIYNKETGTSKILPFFILGFVMYFVPFLILLISFVASHRVKFWWNVRKEHGKAMDSVLNLNNKSAESSTQAFTKRLKNEKTKTKK